MPLDKTIKKVLLIGSGPIVIGQAAEFDYAGTQALRVLREDGIKVVLVNSNPATIMTDNAMADAIYIEPLTLTTIKRIIEKERPDSILSGLGGQTGLTLCMQLAKEGFLEKMNVRLLGSSVETIDKAEDRQIFKDTMEKIGQPCIPSVIATELQKAIAFADEIGYPVIIRPAFTLGGTGGGIVKNEKELREVAANGISLSPIGQILVEKCISGWKEIEFEVMRDTNNNAITICSMENVDPVGIHTGDSIVVAPAVTLSDKEYQMLRTAALDIVRELQVAGGCNCQFALHPTSFRYAVIEVNPRVSRSSALASKATGYPIAKVSTKIAIGYNLNEIVNQVTGNTFAAFEPTIDYIAVKFPRWAFDKFVYAKKELGTQMKATGEVMSMADSFEAALLKAVRGAEIGLSSLRLPKLADVADSEIKKMLDVVTDERLFVVYEAILRGFSIDELYEQTMIDRWFLYKLRNIAKGFCVKKDFIYKMVDTCGGEFRAMTPYFYSIDNGVENEAIPFIESSTKERVLVLGSGPIRIGQGIEFDYACVHCVYTLKKMGYEVIVINNNPETVSTDFDTADRLYFEPLCIDDVMGVIDLEKPIGVVVAFGGGTAIKLTAQLAKRGVKIIGTCADSIDICEDRERFDALLEKLSINRPKGFAVNSESEAITAAKTLGFPVLLRPSYVLGGQNMIIAYSKEDVCEYMKIIMATSPDNPVLVDMYLSGLELEVDAICDGETVLIPGIMEHIERTGVHSGDSIAVYPATHIDDDMQQHIFDVTKKMCDALDVKGLVNIQYVIWQSQLFVIEVNPRASRTVPYISKVTGVAMCELATRVSMGEKLKNLGYTSGIAPVPPYTAVKVPVFSFEKLTDVDTQLGPEMKSTGEVLGLGKNLSEALFKGLVAAGYKMKKTGGVFISVRRSDKAEINDIAKKFAGMGFTLYATGGTAKLLQKAGLAVISVNKIHESDENNTITLLESGNISYVISTSQKGRSPVRDSVKIRRKAVLLGVPCLTSIDTANALADSLCSRYSEINTELIDINKMRNSRTKLYFTKMQTCGNDYIYINCLGEEINSPESLSVFLADRHFGIGADGVVLMLPSQCADVRMRVFNLDGSEGRMGGNAVLCIAKYLFDNGIVKRRKMQIETQSGIKSVSITTQNGIATWVSVDMGEPLFAPKDLPTTLTGECITDRMIEIDNCSYNITCVSMGNPHAVVFSDAVDNLNLSHIGPLFEHSPLFPERINTEFAQIIGESSIRMRVFERGNGETKACGTGASAVAVAAVLCGHCKKGDDIRIVQPGGELIVNYDGKTVVMTGECKTVFEGSVEI